MIHALDLIFEHCDLSVDRCEPVHGGDINQCYAVYTAAEKYFLKVNDAARFPAMFEKEARGLLLLQDHFSGKVPQVLKVGVADKDQFLLLEWIETGHIGSMGWEMFGHSLAAMHRCSDTHAGLPEDNYIGSLPQVNRRLDNWARFYGECRIVPMASRLFATGGFTKTDIKHADRLCNRLPDLFPEEPMALLHGDLWSGNKIFTLEGVATIIDPAVYYGHREIDLGMAKLFGGFDDRFFESYHEAYPLVDDWEQRLPLTQLYPILVHAVLFGGHYVQEAARVIRSFV